MRRLPPLKSGALLLLLIAGALLFAVACNDNDFDAAPDDRGAAAAQTAGAREREQPAAQAEQQEQPQQEAQQQAAPVVATSGDPDRGQELFFANGCNVCHGENGEGLIGPTIASTNFTITQVTEQYRSPRGTVMPEFPVDRVPDADVADIYAWLQTLPLPDVIVPGLGTPQ